MPLETQYSGQAFPTLILARCNRSGDIHISKEFHDVGGTGVSITRITSHREQIPGLDSRDNITLSRASPMTVNAGRSPTTRRRDQSHINVTMAEAMISELNAALTITGR